MQHSQHPSLSSCTQASCRGLTAPGRAVLRAAAKAAWPAAAAVTVMAAAAGSADARSTNSSSSSSKHPPRVQAVLDWLSHNPMTVSSLAMQYDAEPTTPLPECIQGLSPADVVSSQQHASSDMAKVIAGLLYAACGGLDQAHNLVTPLCWGSWTPYAGTMRGCQPASPAILAAVQHKHTQSCTGRGITTAALPCCMCVWTLQPAHAGQPVANSPAAAEAAYVHAIGL
jgi:hypothetical protein